MNYPISLPKSEAERIKNITKQYKPTLSADDIISGCTGYAMLVIPPFEYQKGRRRECKGGILFVYSNGKKVYPCIAVGGIEVLIKGLVTRKRFAWVDALQKKDCYMADPRSPIRHDVALLWAMIKNALSSDE